MELLVSGADAEVGGATEVLGMGDDATLVEVGNGYSEGVKMLSDVSKVE